MCQAASLYALLAKDDDGRSAEAFGYLEKSLAEQPSLAKLIESDPDMANLQDDERFIQLISIAGGKPQQPAAVAASERK